MGVEWLLQKHAAGHGTRSHRRKASRINDWEVWIVLSAAFGDLPAVDLSGKPDVRYEDVREPPAAPLERFFAVGGVDHVEAFLP
jgi:hypothetical protein